MHEVKELVSLFLILSFFIQVNPPTQEKGEVNPSGRKTGTECSETSAIGSPTAEDPPEVSPSFSNSYHRR